MLRRVAVAEGIQQKFPEWVVLVTARDQDGKPNVMPAGWVMCTSADPPMMAVGVRPDRYTHDCIAQTGEFALAWAGEGQADLIMATGSSSGCDINKFEEFNIPHTAAREISVPLILGCHAYLECKLVCQMTTGDHTLFAGEVVAAHLPDPPVAKLENFNGQFVVAEKSTHP